MTKYTIRIQNDNPELMEQEFEEGITADGFVLMTVVDGYPDMIVMHGTSVEQVSRFFIMGDETGSCLRQAAAIGEGLQKAKKIMEEDRRDRAMSSLGDTIAKMAKEMGEIRLDDTEEEQK